MIVQNYNIEFGYELIAIIPFAYWLHTQGELEETISSYDSSPLYYFSPKHTETDIRRHSRMWKRMRLLFDNGDVHRTDLDTSRWTPPPYKEHYKHSDISELNKPVLVVCNKFNKEWKKNPINFIDIDTLEYIFDTYQDKYQIIYSRFRPEMGYDDTVDTLDLGEFDMVKKYDVWTIQDLQRDAGCGYNELQLKIYAHCDKFITVQGGTSLLASYFGGDNIIYAQRGMEVRQGIYERWYHLFGGSKIHHVTNYNALRDKAAEIL